MKAHTPARVTVLIWLVLWLSAWNCLRLWTAFAWREPLEEFASRPGPVYIAVSGAFWLAAGLVVLWSLWSRKRWTRGLIAACAAGYTLWYWADRLLFQQLRANWPFILFVNILVILLVVFALKSGFFQREAHEQSQRYP